MVLNNNLLVEKMDRKLLKEKERELKENIKGKIYFKTLIPKLRFSIEVLKLVFKDVKLHKPFRTKKFTS